MLLRMFLIISVFSSIAAISQAAEEKFVRLVCFGVEQDSTKPRYVGERNGFIAIAQQFDNSLNGVAEFVPDNPNFDASALVLAEGKGTFNIYIFHDVEAVKEVVDYKSFASQLLNQEPTSIVEGVLAERAGHQFSLIWDDGLSYIDSYHDTDDYNETYVNQRVKYGGIKILDCPPAYAVSSIDE